MSALCLSHYHLKRPANVQLKVLMLMSMKPSYDIVVCAPYICLKKTFECTSGSSLAYYPCESSYMDASVALDSWTQIAFSENPKTLSSKLDISDMANVPEVQSHMNSSLFTAKCETTDGEPKKKGAVETLFHPALLRSCHSSIYNPPPLDAIRRLCSYPLPSRFAQWLWNRGLAILPFAPSSTQLC